MKEVVDKLLHNEDNSDDGVKQSEKLIDDFMNKHSIFYGGRHRKSTYSSRRRRSTKKRGTQRKPKRRQHRTSRRRM
jgi:hypothetical protein